MTKRKFEIYQYRQTLARMRQGDSDREIARSKTMGRKKIAQVRAIAVARGWLAPDTPLPEDAVLSAALMRKEALPATCISTLEPWRVQIRGRHPGHDRPRHAGAQSRLRRQLLGGISLPPSARVDEVREATCAASAGLNVEEPGLEDFAGVDVGDQGAGAEIGHIAPCVVG